MELRVSLERPLVFGFLGYVAGFEGKLCFEKQVFCFDYQPERKSCGLPPVTNKQTKRSNTSPIIVNG